jgi:hypothetical protein
MTGHMSSEVTSLAQMAISSGATAVTQNPIPMHTRNVAYRASRKDIGMTRVGRSIGRIATMPGAPPRVPGTTTIGTAVRSGTTRDTHRSMA